MARATQNVLMLIENCSIRLMFQGHAGSVLIQGNRNGFGAQIICEFMDIRE